MYSFVSAAIAAVRRRGGDRADRGAVAAEYAIMAAFIAGVIVLAVMAVGEQTLALFATSIDEFVAAGVFSNAG